MGNSWFQFQQFRIHQDRCAMKISTDAVLLGALANGNDPKRILDIGTGTGVISLMLAQRFPEAYITAVELDSDAAGQAGENFRESPFSERLQVKNQRFQDFSEDQLFDLIVSNPPYFPDHLKSHDSKRNQALHTDALPFEELIEKSQKLLQKEGKIWIILPPRQMDDFISLAEKVGLYPYHKVLIRDTETKPVIRMILGFSHHHLIPSIEELIIKKEQGAFSDSYSNLISGFLLGF
jgi:tRNA1Val (adenine37-N6)-methyltransferase